VPASALLAFLIAPPALVAAPIVQELVQQAPTAASAGGVRACPTGYAMAGWRADRNELLCLRMQRGGYTLGRPVRDQGMTSTNQFPGRVLALVTVETPDAFAYIPYRGPSLHWCGPSRVMVGVDGATNTLLCATWATTGASPEQSALAYALDLPPHTTVRADMHACPPGMAMMGVHADANTFVCGEIYNVSAPFKPTDRVVGVFAGLCALRDLRVFYGTTQSYVVVERGDVDRTYFIAPPSGGDAHVIRWQCREPDSRTTSGIILCPHAANVVQVRRPASAAQPMFSVKCTSRDTLG
jgi:hypothetical protein